MNALDEEVAQRLAETAEQCRGVVRLGRGAATHVPGRRIDGVHRIGDRVEVHLVVSPDVPADEVAEAVRDALAPTVDEPIDVVVEDIDTAAAESDLHWHAGDAA